VRDTDGNGLAVSNGNIYAGVRRDHELGCTDGRVHSIAGQRRTSRDHLPHRRPADRRQGGNGRNTDPNRPVIPVHD
jgi:hypothetical protein